jgi:hypothetical protein
VDNAVSIGVGNGFRRPRPPNRACGSPAHGSPVGGFPHRDWLADTLMQKGEQQMCREKAVATCLFDAVSGAANMRSCSDEASTYVHSWSQVSAPCLTLTGTTGAILCSRRSSHASTFLPPFPRRGFAFRTSRGFHRFGIMKALTPVRLTCRAGLPAYLATPSCRSVSNHVGLPDHRLPPRQRDQRVSDFTMNEQARRSSPPNRVRSPTDRQFASGCSPPRFAATQLPSATEFVAYSGTDFHRADMAPSRAHSPPNVLIGGPVRIPPGFPLKACGNDGLVGEFGLGSKTCSIFILCGRA